MLGKDRYVMREKEKGEGKITRDSGRGKVRERAEKENGRFSTV